MERGTQKTSDGPLPRQAECNASRNSVLSMVDVESAREGRNRYGFKRYLVLHFSQRVNASHQNETHIITIKLSRDPSVATILLRSLHIRERLHAPIPSHSVHNKGDSVGDNGRMVENSDSSIGDYARIQEEGLSQDEKTPYLAEDTT